MTIHNTPHLHTEHSLRMSLQRAEQQAILGVSDADGAVVGAHQQNASHALLRCRQATHRPGPVAVKHVQLPIGLLEKGKTETPS